MNIYVIELHNGLVASIKDFGDDSVETNVINAEARFGELVRIVEDDSPAGPMDVEDLQEYIEAGYYDSSNGFDERYSIQLFHG